MKSLVVLVVAVGSCAACDPDDVVLGPKDGCDVGAMRCSGRVVEACGSDQRWVVAQDCDEVQSLSGGLWICDETGDAGPHCSPLDTDGGDNG